MLKRLIEKKRSVSQNQGEVHHNLGMFAGRVGLLSNFLLFILKLIIGLLSGVSPSWLMLSTTCQIVRHP